MHTFFSTLGRSAERVPSPFLRRKNGEALWVHDTFESAWSTGDADPRPVDRLETHGRDHVQKFLEAFVYGDQLAMFWDDNSHVDARQVGEPREVAARRKKAEAHAAAKEANIAKQMGFYVDRKASGDITSPTEIERGVNR